MAERDRTAYDILAEKPEMDLVYSGIRSDLAAIAEESPNYAGVCEFVAEDLIEKLQEEAQKSPTLRIIKRYAGVAILGILGIIYAGLFVYNSLTIDQPIDTKEGLLQHAAAFDKAHTHSEMMGTRARRGGFLKGLLFWPWEPNEQELEAAGNFAGLSLDSLQALTDQGITCNTQFLLSPGEFLDESQTKFVEEVSEFVQAEQTVWQDAPIMTPVPFMVERYGCPDTGNAE